VGFNRNASLSGGTISLLLRGTVDLSYEVDPQLGSDSELLSPPNDTI
jgi:hypothetical protein